MDPAGSQDKRPVPKFASFKAPAATAPAVDQSSERQSRDARGEERSKHRSSRHRSHRDRSRSRERRRERREHHHSRRRDERGEEAAAERRKEPRSAVTGTGIQEEDKDLFVIDTKGDRYNVLYGTLHRYSVPEYRRFGRGSVLGLPPSYKIDRETEGNTLVIRAGSWKPGSSKLKSKNILSGLRKEKGRLLRVRPQSIPDSAADASEDFLSLDVSAPRGSGQTGVEDVDSDDNEKYAYRSIHGKAKPEDYLPKGVEAVSGTDSEDEGYTIAFNEEIKQINADLIRRTQDNPSDVEAWLRLIDHQDALLTGTTEESRALTYAERTSLADIKVSIYQKALKQAGDTSAKERLLLGLLAEGAKLWDTKKLSEQWQSTLKANSQFIGLWVKYLDFRQTQFLDFTYDRCLSTFIDCLKLSQSSPDNTEKVYVQSYLFLRLTLFIREAGFVEQAVGLWQAILELVFFRPDGLDLQNDREKAVSQLVQFWESEVARIGELGAKGWKSGSNAYFEPIALSKSAPVIPKLVFESWTTSERERITKARLPARSLDELEDDDPFRVVLSSDFGEVILLLCDLVPADLLVDGFLYFCHLPPLISPNNAQTTGRWRSDNFVQNGYMSYPDFTHDDWFIGPEKDTGSIVPGLLSFPHPNFTQTLDTLFPGQKKWFSSFQSWAKSTENTPSDIDPDWVRRAIRLLLEANPANDDLAEYSLALEFAFNGKEAKKFAKSLLKKRSSSLRLYNAYALMEYRSENHSAANHVWATALSMSKTLGENSRTDNGLLWRTWIWESLDVQDLALASRLLVALPHQSVDLKSITEASDQPVFSATNLLKTQNFLSEAQEHALATRKANVFVAYTDCLAILTYLSQSLELEKAVETFSTALRRLAILPAQAESFRSFTTELLHQSQAKLIFYHVRNGNAYKPSHVRNLLADSISQHPHNTIFLCLFAWNESRSRIEERVRDVVRNITYAPNNSTQTHQVPVTTHLFSIYSELSRPVYAGSTLHSVRAAFEKAIGDSKPASPSNTAQSSDASNTSNSTARSNVTIWKLYILFELSRGNVQRAKDVFYRAMRSCPWSKELIMLAFGHLRADIVRKRFGEDKTAASGMGFAELRGVYNVLVEKELRIHVDIEGLLDDIAMDGDAQRLQGSSTGLPFTLPEDAGSGDEMQL